jgi:hypothetical protein
LTIDAVRALRVGTSQSIKENPVTVQISRITFTQNENGGRTITAALMPDPFVGRLVYGQRRGAQGSTNEAGPRETNEAYLSAPYNADVLDGSGVEDTFEAGGKKYLIRRVIVRKIFNQTFAKYCTLEEIS